VFVTDTYKQNEYEWERRDQRQNQMIMYNIDPQNKASWPKHS